MAKVSPPSTIIPLLISEGQYLDEFQMKKIYIKYIRNLETARILYKKNKKLISNKELLNVFDKGNYPLGYIY